MLSRLIGLLFLGSVLGACVVAPAPYPYGTGYGWGYDHGYGYHPWHPCYRCGYY